MIFEIHDPNTHPQIGDYAWYKNKFGDLKRCRFYELNKTMSYFTFHVMDFSINRFIESGDYYALCDESGWISVKDELPEEGEVIQMYDKVQDENMSGVRIGNLWFHIRPYCNVKHIVEEGSISHWQPALKKPKEL